MKIKTFRFGEIDIEDDDVIRFPEGLVGLTRYGRFVMMRDPESVELIWLQSLDHADFALATVHHSRLATDYRVEVNPQEVASINLRDLDDAEIFVILNRVEGTFSANLRGPLVINTKEMLGKQVVLNNPAYSVRHALAPSKGAPMSVRSQADAGAVTTA